MWLTPEFNEQEDLLQRFMEELRRPTRDGAKKRGRKEKPPWYADDAHEAAIFSHLMKWKRGELVDPDSGAHPLVHVAWRCLAIACKETGNVPLETLAEYFDRTKIRHEEALRKLGHSDRADGFA